MSRTDVWYMVRRRASDAGIETAIGCHTFRATGITDYLTNGGRIEVAQRMAGHSNAKTTGLYDRRDDDISVGEVERIGIEYQTFFYLLILSTLLQVERKA
jgi:integrase